MPKQQVAFQFGREHEVRYIRELPEVGNRIRVGTELWLVTSVEQDTVGTSVICERLHVPAPSEGLHPGLAETGER
jgi:hypothetical protein